MKETQGSRPATRKPAPAPNNRVTSGAGAGGGYSTATGKVSTTTRPGPARSLNQQTSGSRAGGGYSTPSGGNKTVADVYNVPDYTPGGFDDPTIDWQAIYNTFIAPQNAGPSAPSAPSYSDPGPASYSPPPAPAPPPAVFQSPSSYTPPAVTQTPEISSTSIGGDGPVGLDYNALGTGMTGGMYDRRRNQRSPRSDISVTPEMLRRAAQSRLG